MTPEHWSYTAAIMVWILAAVALAGLYWLALTLIQDWAYRRALKRRLREK